MTSMLELKNISKSFDDNTVLNNVNLKLPKGQKITIIGPSGSGKSTILKLILGLIPPDSGAILFNDQSLIEMDEQKLYKVRLKIGLLFQSSALFDSMTVEENVGFSLIESPDNYSDSTIKHKVNKALALVDMSRSNAYMPSELSGGQQKRIGLARAIINYPDLLLFDEPTTGLDPILSTSIENLIVNTTEELHTTSIIVTHQISTILRTSDLIYYLYNGELLEPETPETIYQSKNPIIKNFIMGKDHDA